jgi:hypothetical protein
MQMKNIFFLMIAFLIAGNGFVGDAWGMNEEEEDLLDRQTEKLKKTNRAANFNAIHIRRYLPQVVFNDNNTSTDVSKSVDSSIKRSEKYEEACILRALEFEQELLFLPQKIKMLKDQEKALFELKLEQLDAVKEHQRKKLFTFDNAADTAMAIIESFGKNFVATAAQLLAQAAVVKSIAGIGELYQSKYPTYEQYMDKKNFLNVKINDIQSTFRDGIEAGVYKIDNPEDLDDIMRGEIMIKQLKDEYKKINREQFGLNGVSQTKLDAVKAHRSRAYRTTTKA